MLFQLVCFCFKNNHAVAVCIDRKLDAECDHGFPNALILLLPCQSGVAFRLTFDVGNIDRYASFPNTVSTQRNDFTLFGFGNVLFFLRVKNKICVPS